MAYVTTHAKRIPEWKVKQVEELSELAKSHKVILIVDLTKTPTAQLQKLRRKLERRLGNNIVMRVAKNTLFRIALERAGINTKPLEDYLTGVNMLIFTNINPFEIAMALNKAFTTAPAKPGDKAPTDIVIPAGNTGFKPGPIMSVFGKLKIPIRVQGGTIWIAKDTRVAKPGDTISPELSSLLQRLGIEPIVVKLKIKAAYDSGIVIPGDKLVLDLNAYRDDVARAHLNALRLGAEIAYPEPSILEITIPLAVKRALAVAAEAGYVTSDNAEYVLRLAINRALAVASALGDTAKELGIEVQPASQQPSAPAKEKKEEREEEKEEEKKESVNEEQLAAGLESLFGS